MPSTSGQSVVPHGADDLLVLWNPLIWGMEKKKAHYPLARVKEIVGTLEPGMLYESMTTHIGHTVGRTCITRPVATAKWLTLRADRVVLQFKEK